VNDWRREAGASRPGAGCAASSRTRFRVYRPIPPPEKYRVRQWR
jgi:hypothetical protein